MKAPRDREGKAEEGSRNTREVKLHRRSIEPSSYFSPHFSLSRLLLLFLLLFPALLLSLPPSRPQTCPFFAMRDTEWVVIRK
jgi:hypothetical protein